MKKMFEGDKRRRVLFSILMIVIGLILVIWPGHVMTTTLRVLVIALLIGGVICGVSWYRGRMKGVSFLTLAEGILLAIAGIVVLSAPKVLVSIVPVAVGIVVTVNGVINLAQALDLKREGYARWPGSLALAVLTIVLGLLVVFNPFSTMEMLVVALGVVILYNGVSNLWIESRYRKL